MRISDWSSDVCSSDLIQPDAFDLSSRSVILPIVPMFHANSWGVPYAAATVGAKLVFSATNDAQVLCDLMHDEGVTHSAGVPTVWIAMFARSEEHTYELQSLMRISYAVFCLKKTT